MDAELSHGAAELGLRGIHPRELLGDAQLLRRAVVGEDAALVGVEGDRKPPAGIHLPHQLVVGFGDLLPGEPQGEQRTLRIIDGRVQMAIPSGLEPVVPAGVQLHQLPGPAARLPAVVAFRLPFLAAAGEPRLPEDPVHRRAREDQAMLLHELLGEMAEVEVHVPLAIQGHHLDAHLGGHRMCRSPAHIAMDDRLRPLVPNGSAQHLDPGHAQAQQFRCPLLGDLLLQHLFNDRQPLCLSLAHRYPFHPPSLTLSRLKRYCFH
ncbi:MAG: hypothetical protein CVV48_14845 [Spirochaetae bacterium HGW-Spirochaetae-4]|nr:MAG: hypothetical protein CVV48_14845 [Spirochaetae bacterium HGW-Spirochaetae-4]